MLSLRRIAQIAGQAFRTPMPGFQHGLEYSQVITSKEHAEADSASTSRFAQSRSHCNHCACMHCQHSFLQQTSSRPLHSSALSAASTSAQVSAAAFAYIPSQRFRLGWLMGQRNLNREPEPFEGEYNEDEFEDGEFEDFDLQQDEGWADLDLENLESGDDWEGGEDEDNSDDLQQESS